MGFFLQLLLLRRQDMCLHFTYVNVGEYILLGLSRKQAYVMGREYSNLPALYFFPLLILLATLSWE